MKEDPPASQQLQPAIGDGLIVSAILWLWIEVSSQSSEQLLGEGCG